MYDIVIVGMGPAGATLARLLDCRFQVACIDQKSDAPGSFQKPCGGLLAPDAQRALAKFELTLPNDILASPQIFSVKTFDLVSGLVQNYQRFYMNLDRHKFDRWLLSLVPARVRLFAGCRCTRIEKSEAGYAVSFRENGAEKTLQTRFVVGADGANSIVRRYLYPEKKTRSYLAIQQWFSERNAKPFYSCVFDGANTDCYSWSISKDDRFIFGGAYPAKGCRAAFERQKKLLEAKGLVFGTALKTEACRVLRPARPGDLCCGREGAFLIGEAGGFVSPSSLEGISSAICTAQLLSETLNAGDKNPNASYRRKTRGLRVKLLVKLLKCPFIYNGNLRRLVMKSGLQKL